MLTNKVSRTFSLTISGQHNKVFAIMFHSKSMKDALYCHYNSVHLVSISLDTYYQDVHIAGHML